MEGQRLAIGAVSQAAGISTSALRYYESMGLIPAPNRINGRRVYDETVFSYLATIQLAQESGFTVAEIKRLLDSCNSPPKDRRWKDLAKTKVEELDRTINRAKAMKKILHQWLDCECVTLEDCRLISERLAR